MSKIIAQFTMSLDGFIAGPNDEVDRLMRWYFSGDTSFQIGNTGMVFRTSRASADLLRQEWGMLGAMVTGRRDFDVSKAWGGSSPLGIPIFIVTHMPPQEWAGKESPFTFVTDGVEHAIEQARHMAGEKNIGISGSKIIGQCLNAGWLDEIQIDLVPILLCAGVRLFDHLDSGPIQLENIGVIEGTGVTHLRFRVIK